MPSRSAAIVLLLALVLPGAAGPARAEVFLSKEEAIAVAFPDADRVESHTYVLDDGQAAAVERESGALESRLVTVYTGYRGGAVEGHALIDVHTVRTLPEALLVVLSPDGAVTNLRMIAFYEPPEYRAPERWLAQFEHGAGDGAEVHGIAGATLSTRAVEGSIRRALALHRLLLAPRAPAPPPLAKDGRPAPIVAGSGGGQ